MELSEAKEVLKECINTIGIAYIPCRGKHKKIGLSTKDKIAIETVLQTLEELQKENEGLKKLSDHYRNLINYKYIQKDKIKEKIEKLREIADEDNMDEFIKINMLEDLLEGE